MRNGLTTANVIFMRLSATLAVSLGFYSVVEPCLPRDWVLTLV